MNNKDSLGDRMKRYEHAISPKVIQRLPTIIRLDGKAFHSYLAPLKSRVKSDPWDLDYHETMERTVRYLCNNIQNVVLGYSQSDEITLLLKDDKELNTQQWFNGKLYKMLSISASMASGAFNMYARDTGLSASITQPFAMFDSRIFNIPKEDVANNFIWRQQDATRNSIQMLGRHHFSHKQMDKLNTSKVQDLLMNIHGINWNDIDVWKKRGFCVKRAKRNNNLWLIDDNIPIFTKDRAYIEDLL